TVFPIRAANMLEVEIGDSLLQRDQWMPAVVARAKQAFLLTEVGDEKDAAPWTWPGAGQGGSDLDHGCHTAGVVIGAVVDQIAFARCFLAEVIVVGGDHDIAVRQRRIGAWPQTRHVAEAHWSVDRRRQSQ